MPVSKCKYPHPSPPMPGMHYLSLTAVMQYTRTENQYSYFLFQLICRSWWICIASFLQIDGKASLVRVLMNMIICIIHIGRGLRLGIPNPIHKWSSSIREFEHKTGAASTHDREVNSWCFHLKFACSTQLGFSF